MRMIRYQAKAAQAAANEQLVRAVFDELHSTQPAGLSYAVYRLADEVTFVHLVDTAGPGQSSPLLAVKAFGEFQAGHGDRCDQPPVAEELKELGRYQNGLVSPFAVYPSRQPSQR
jgi:hypothetical protein